jgi:hypothetical protein
MSEKRTPACGNSKCGTSTGIHGGLTFGHGRLDEWGYWEHPCRACAAEFDAALPNEIAAVREQLLANGNTQSQVDEYIALAEWLHQAGWPFDDSDIAKLELEWQEHYSSQDLNIDLLESELLDELEREEMQEREYGQLNTEL